MSVSVDKPVSHSPPSTLQPKAHFRANDTITSQGDGQRIGFNSSNNNPIMLFANQTPAADGNGLLRDGRHASMPTAQTPTGFSHFKQKLKGWCGGHRPPKPSPCNSKPPVRPDPSKPDPCYSRPPERPTPSRPPARPNPSMPAPCYGASDPVYSAKSSDELSRLLLNNFDAFKDPRTPGFVTTRGIADMARKPLTGDPTQDRNIRLARELMKRPEVVNALDRHSRTGALDGLIDRQKIQMTLNSQSPLKYQDDGRLADEILLHFDKLRDPRNPDYISIDNLRRLAAMPTNDPINGRLAWIAQEVLKRSEVMANMDGGDRWGKDGWIHQDTLRRMAG